jgi:hypothetical protein
MTDTKIRTLLFLLPLLALACTLSAIGTPPPQDGRGALVAQTVKPTEQTASPTPAPQVCQVKNGAGALNLRACGATSCPVVIALREGETLIQTEPQTVDGWLAVETASGLRGWVNSKYCEVMK